MPQHSNSASEICDRSIVSKLSAYVDAGLH